VTARMLDFAAPVLRAVRVGAKLSQIELAERAGVSHATISRMEAGKAWPSARNVDRDRRLRDRHRPQPA
jgi:transcriptional regulator with XRE-family HTH domain